jgi:hypothetical protein
MNKIVRSRDIVELPSGVEIDLHNFDVGECKTSEDAFELLQAIQEKIIEIEYHIDLFEAAGCRPNGTPYSTGDRIDLTWMPRAKKALAWAKVQKADAQMRMQSIAKKEKADERRSIGIAFMDQARLSLADDVFDAILKKAVAKLEAAQ